jgi:hypothetical protein
MTHMFRNYDFAAHLGLALWGVAGVRGMCIGSDPAGASPSRNT